MMDFKPLKKDRKPGADGLWGWESPRLREALKAAKEAGKQLVAKGMTPTNYRTTKDVDMIARDLGAACAQAPIADGCNHSTYWVPGGSYLVSRCPKCQKIYWTAV